MWNFRQILKRISDMKYSNNPFGTHAPFLEDCLDYSIDISPRGESVQWIEIGTGGESSRIFRERLEKEPRANLLSLESDPIWIEKYKLEYQAHPRHTLLVINTEKSWLSAVQEIVRGAEEKEIGLVFIDSIPWDSRTTPMLLLRNVAKLILIHDVDYFPHNALWGLEVEQIKYNPVKWNKYGNLQRINLGYRDYSEVFSSWVEAFPIKPGFFTGPPTLIGSNFLDVEAIPFKQNELIIRSSIPPIS